MNASERDREWKDTENKGVAEQPQGEGRLGRRYLVGDGTDFNGDVLLPGFSQDCRVLAQSKPMADPGRDSVSQHPEDFCLREFPQIWE